MSRRTEPRSEPRTESSPAKSNAPKDDLQAPESSPPRSGMSFSFWAGGLLLAIGVLTWLAPSIVAMTELRHQILSAALPDYPGRMEVGAASLGWFSPAILQDVQIYDLQGELLLSLGGVSTESSLLSLATDRAHLGKISIEKPKVRIVARKDGSNLEDALAKLLPKPSEGTPSAPPELTLAVSGGELELIEAGTKKSWKWRNLHGEVSPPRGGEPILRAQVEGVGGEASSDSAISAKVTWQLPEKKGGAGFGKGMIELQSAGLPFAAVQLIASRFVSDLKLEGRFAPELKIGWDDASDGGATWRATGKLAASDLAATAPSLVGKDQLRMAQLATEFDATLSGDRLNVTNLVIMSDIASASCKGSSRLDLGSSSRLIAGLLEALRREDCQIDGRVDLARLAALLPDTLHLRPGTQITGGELQIVLSSAAKEGARRFTGRVDASNLTALDSGRAIHWEQPLQFQLAAIDGPSGPVIETLTCKSEFVQAQAQGTLQRGELAIQCDLDRLARELAKVVDLGSVQMAGQVGGRIGWETKANSQIAATGKLQIDGLNLALPGRRPWTERQLILDATIAGTIGTSSYYLDAFDGVIASGNDRLEVKWLEPRKVSFAAPLPLSVKLQGDLASWQPRTELFVAPSGWNLAGQVKLDAEGAFSPEVSNIESAKIDLAQLVVQNGTGRIEEPQLHLETSVDWNSMRREFLCLQTTLVTTSLALRADRLQVSLPAEGKPFMEGDIAFRGDLARLSRWISITGQPPSWAAAGQIAGGARLTQKADTISAAWNATIDNAALYAAPSAAPASGATAFRPAAQTPAWQEIWSEKQIVMQGQGTYQGDQDLAQLEQFSIGGAGLALKAKGVTQKLRSSPAVNLEGNLDYDLATLAERFRGLIGPIKIAGRESKPFKLEGPLLAAGLPTSVAPGGAAASTPLLSPDLKGQFGFGWSGVEVLGLNVGPGAVDAKLAGSQVEVPPLDVSIEDGRLVAAPRVFLFAPQPTLAVGQGRVLENVRLSPELCRAWMKYVTPLLADVTQIDGRFSVDLVGGQVPLTDPNRLGAQGTIEIREITAGPGPAAQPLVNLTRQLKGILDKKQLLGLGQSQPTWIHLPAQKIEFQVVDGRVYHRNLLMKVGDITMRTSGSVGLDQSLDVMSEVPVLDQWIDKEKAFAPLRGQMLKIPVRGSLGAPKFDLKVLKDLGGLVTGGLLDKFLGGQKP